MGTASRVRQRAAAAAALVVLAGGAWWVTHPGELDPVGNRSGVTAGVGQAVLVGVAAYPRDGSVLLRSATPRVRAASAAADVRVVFCTGGAVLGSSRAPVEQACAQVHAVAGQRLARPSAGNRYGQLLLEITPREPGLVLVDGVDIGYSTGLRRGSQASGVVVEVEALRP